MKTRALLFGLTVLVLAGLVLWWLPSRPDDSPLSRRELAPSDPKPVEDVEPGWSVADPRRGAETHGGEVNGRVLDGDSRARVDAEVCIVLLENRASDEMREPRCGPVDNEGRFRFGPLLAGRYGLSASARGLQPAHFPGEGDPPLAIVAGKTLTVDLILTGVGREVTGRVVDALGGPVAGAVVEAQRGWRGPADAVTLSRPDGTFELWMPEGALSVRASAEGYGAERRFVVAPSTGIELRLTPGATIQGQVLWAETGTPGSHAQVSARDDSGRRGGRERTVLADADGAFSLDGLAPGRYQLVAELPEGYGEGDAAVAVGLLENAGPVRIALRTAASLRIQLRFDDDAPCTDGGATVFRLPAGPFQRGRSTPDGIVELTSLLPGEYRLRARCADGYGADDEEDRFVTLAAGELASTTVRFERGTTVRGRMLRGDGSPITRAFVFLLHDERGQEDATRVDGDGAFSFRGVQPGSYALEPRVSWRSPLAEAIAVQVPEGGAEQDIVIDESARVEGVVESGGRSLAFAEVTLAGAGPGVTTVTDGDGRFFFDPVPFGTYVPRVRLGGQSLEVDSPQRLEVESTATQSLLIATESTDGQIRGRVVDASGAALADVLVNVENAAGGRRQPFRSGSRPVLTDGAGRFEIDELADDEYAVVAVRPTGGAGRVEGVRVGSEVTVTVASPTLLEGRVLWEDGSPVQDYSLRVDHDRERFVRSQRVSNSDASFSLPDVPPGRIRVEATSTTGTGVLDLTVAEGEIRRDIVLTMRSTSAVSGIVIDVESGAPVGGLVVSLAPVWNERSLWRFNSGRRSRTDSNGRFQIQGGPAGSAALVVYDRDRVGYGPTRLRVTLDPGEQVDVGTVPVARERLRQASDAGELGLSLDLSDAAMERGDPLEIDAITGGSAAADAGVRPGDVVTSVDGLSVTGRNTSLFRTLVRKPVGEAVELGLSDGRVLTLEVR